jgi:hypothetical protein
MNIRYICAALALMAGTSTGVAAANLVKDGGFENPVVPDGGLTRFSTGDRIRKWKVVGATGTVDIINTNFTFAGFGCPSKGGVQWLDLSGNSDTATGVQQTIPTTPGATYSITFFIGSVYDPTGPLGTTSTVNVLVDGGQIASFTSKGKKGTTAQTWRKFSTEFVATADKTTVAFINGDPPSDTDCGIDNVSVTQVPGS